MKKVHRCHLVRVAFDRDVGHWGNPENPEFSRCFVRDRSLLAYAVVRLLLGSHSTNFRQEYAETREGYCFLPQIRCGAMGWGRIRLTWLPRHIQKVDGMGGKDSDLQQDSKDSNSVRVLRHGRLKLKRNSATAVLHLEIVMGALAGKEVRKRTV